MAVTLTPTDGTTIQPNIVHIFLDDPMLELMGFMAPRQDWGGAHALRPQTPFLDSMCEAGVLCLDHYANPVCSTSRATMLTGLYPHTHGVGTVVDVSRKSPVFAEFNVQAGYNGLSTTAMLLKAAGYNTGIVGKWHLANHTTDVPAGTGFPHIKLASNGGGFDDARCVFSNLVVPPDVGYYNYNWWDGTTVTAETEYLTSKQATEAIDFTTTSSEPFYLYMPTNDTHDPLDAVPAGLPYSDDFDPPAVAAVYTRYTAHIEGLDRELQRFYDNIPIQKRDRTIFFISADNGSSDDVLENARDQFGLNIGDTHDFLTDRPERRWKQSVYEGGARSWCIIAGKPVHTPGRTSGVLTHITDFMPTFLDLAHAAHPAGLVGYSMEPIIKNDTLGRDTWARQQVLTDHWSPNGDWTAITGAETNTNFFRRAFSSQVNVSGRWKLIQDYTLPDLLYQLEGPGGVRIDPHERNPIDWTSGTGATVKSELETQLTAELAR